MIFLDTIQDFPHRLRDVADRLSRYANEADRAGLDSLRPAAEDEIGGLLVLLHHDLIGAGLLAPECADCDPVLEACGADASQEELEALARWEGAMEGFCRRTNT